MERFFGIKSVLFLFVILSLGVSAAMSLPMGENPVDAVLSSDGSYELDPVHTSVVFRTTHLGVSVFYGRFNKVSGSFVINKDNLKECSVDITVEAESVDTNDKIRDNHLQSPDFLNVKTFPAITFKGKGFEKAHGNKVRVTGDIMLHGVTKEIAVTLEHIGAGKDPWGGFRAGFDGSFTVKRSDFDMNFMMGPVGDEITIFLGVEGIKK